MVIIQFPVLKHKYTDVSFLSFITFCSRPKRRYSLTKYYILYYMFYLLVFCTILYHKINASDEHPSLLALLILSIHLFLFMYKSVHFSVVFYSTVLVMLFFSIVTRILTYPILICNSLCSYCCLIVFSLTQRFLQPYSTVFQQSRTLAEYLCPRLKTLIAIFKFTLFINVQ